MSEESDLGRNLGLWSHADGQRRAVQTILDNLNRRFDQVTVSMSYQPGFGGVVRVWGIGQ